MISVLCLRNREADVWQRERISASYRAPSPSAWSQIFYDSDNQTERLVILFRSPPCFRALAIGCATYSGPSDNRTDIDVSPPSEKQSVDYVAPPTVASREIDNSTAVATLWKSRMTGDAIDVSSRGFVLGPGDLLRVSVPLIDQLKDRTVRVSEDGRSRCHLLG